MAELKISIIDNTHSTKATALTGSTITTLVHKASYEEGDMIALELSQPGCYCKLQLDDAMKPAIVYIEKSTVYYKIPFGEKRAAVSPKAFSGNCHVISARLLQEEEVETRRNLALNPYDGFASPGLFPHATANVETRDEAVFAARNAIDGIYANDSHGKFPYGSWGINQQDDAEWMLEFGRAVIIDELRITLRADYPHDNYWTALTVEFSDGSAEALTLTKSGQPQIFAINPRKVTGLKITALKKANLISLFPALTQFEAWGCNCK